jgi:hypothetical protein
LLNLIHSSINALASASLLNLIVSTLASAFS